MGLSGLFKSALKQVDRKFAQLSLQVLDEKPVLLTFLFHGLFKDQAEINSNLVDPQQGFTLAHFRQFLEYFSNAGYTFVSPVAIEQKLDPNGKYVLITFDDGYFSSFRALPLLEEFNAPAVFFVSTDQVSRNRCFWWDVYYREQLKRGHSERSMAAERNELKKLSYDEIERRLALSFGENSFKPRGDIDRAVTPEELKRFAANRYVFIGNHTVNHAILPTLTLGDAKLQIDKSQTALEQMTGNIPKYIAYPNGDFSADIIKLSHDAGFQLGLTVTPGKNILPLNASQHDHLLLKRYTLDGFSSVAEQCSVCRAKYSLFYSLRNAKHAY